MRTMSLLAVIALCPLAAQEMAALIPQETNAPVINGPRTLLPQAAATPSAFEQLSLELLNRARANPQAEAARYGIDLNEGLSAGTISTTPKQPLAWNQYLIAAAQTHSQWMLDNNTFSHTGAGGSNSSTRMKNAGYTFSGSWGSGENLAWRGTSGTPNITSLILDEHADLFIDQGISGRGHRINMLRDSYREVGIGAQSGAFTTSNGTFNGVMQTQDFAYSGSWYFITGVIYQDTVTKDNFYTPGEGWGNVTLEALQGNTVIASSVSFGSGGYQLSVANGSYSLRASGGGLATPIVIPKVVINGANVKVDIDPTATPAPGSQRRIRVHSIAGYTWSSLPMLTPQLDASWANFTLMDSNSDLRLHLSPENNG